MRNGGMDCIRTKPHSDLRIALLTDYCAKALAVLLPPALRDLAGLLVARSAYRFQSHRRRHHHHQSVHGRFAMLLPVRQLQMVHCGPGVFAHAGRGCHPCRVQPWCGGRRLPQPLLDASVLQCEKQHPPSASRARRQGLSRVMRCGAVQCSAINCRLCGSTSDGRTRHVNQKRLSSQPRRSPSPLLPIYTRGPLRQASFVLMCRLDMRFSFACITKSSPVRHGNCPTRPSIGSWPASTSCPFCLHFSSEIFEKEKKGGVCSWPAAVDGSRVHTCAKRRVCVAASRGSEVCQRAGMTGRHWRLAILPLTFFI